MKILKSKKVERSCLVRLNRYIVTMEIDDNDINMFEDLAYAYVTQGAYDEKYRKEKNYDEYDLLPSITRRSKIWFQELWKNCWKEDNNEK